MAPTTLTHKEQKKQKKKDNKMNKIHCYINTQLWRAA